MAPRVRPDLETCLKEFAATDRMGSLIGGRALSLNETECVFEYTVNPNHFNPNGILHGGALFSVMDSSQGLFVYWILDPQYPAAATGTAIIKYLLPVRSGKITIHTKLKEIQGRKIMVSSVALNEQKQPVAELEEIWVAFKA